MLEIRDYAKPELSAMFGTRNMENLKRKMERYGITFEVNGRGENAVFTIKEIEDPFKIYCITELDFDGRSDFRKALIFYYYFFNDVEFRTMPDEVKEYRMRDQKQDVSRQTIATYISKLDRKNLVDRNSSDFIYYFACKQTQRITDQEEYLRAWHEHWARLKDGWDSYSSIMQMFADYGGEKKRVTLRFINPLLDTAIERFGTKDVIYSKVDDTHFSVTAQVEISNQFFGWILGFGNRVRLLAPDDVADQFRAYLDKIRGMY